MPRSEVVVFLVRQRSREVLVLQRSAASGGFWHVVAGAVERDESPDEAAVRELMEEVGLALQPLEPVGRTAFTYAFADSPADSGELEDVAVECVLVEVPDDYQPTLNAEHDAYRWCSCDEARALLRWSNVADALNALVAAPAESSTRSSSRKVTRSSRPEVR